MNNARFGIIYRSLTEKTKRYRDKLTGQYKFDNPDSNNFFKYFSVKGYSQYAKINDNMDRTLTSRSEERKYYLKMILQAEILNLEVI